AVPRELGAARPLVSVIGPAAAPGAVIVVILPGAQRGIVAVVKHVAKNQVLRKPDPEALATPVVPIAVLIRSLVGRRHIRETGGLRHALGFRIIFAGALMLDRHAEVAFYRLILRRRHLHPPLVRRDLALFRGHIDE